jgi:hypothetical protein
MLEGIRARINELQVNGEAFDEFAGLPKGYLNKIAGSRPIRRVGMLSMGPLLQALGIKCVFLEDPEATQRLKKRLKPRNSNLVRSAVTEVRLTRRFMQKIGRMGAAVRFSKMTPEERSKLARRLNKARWRKPRVI